MLRRARRRPWRGGTVAGRRARSRASRGWRARRGLERSGCSSSSRPTRSSDVASRRDVRLAEPDVPRVAEAPEQRRGRRSRRRPAGPPPNAALAPVRQPRRACRRRGARARAQHAPLGDAPSTAPRAARDAARRPSTLTCAPTLARDERRLAVERHALQPEPRACQVDERGHPLRHQRVADERPREGRVRQLLAGGRAASRRSGRAPSSRTSTRAPELVARLGEPQR